MNTESLIVLGITIIIILAGGYFLHTKITDISSQTMALVDEISTLKTRFKNLESIFMRPPEADVESIFEKPSTCTNGICSFAPMSPMIEEPDLEKIAQDEFSNMEDDDKDDDDKDVKTKNPKK